MIDLLLSLFGFSVSVSMGVLIGWHHRDKRANHDAQAHAEATADAILYSMNGFDDQTLRDLYQNNSNGHLTLMKGKRSWEK